MFENKKKHESYGMLAFSRQHGSTIPLFGTSVKHSDTICMRLKHGAVERQLNSDFYYGEGLIAEVVMSYSQFAEAITAMNCGDGVPVTIRYLNGQTMEHCPFEDKKDQFEHEFEDNLNKTNEQVNTLIMNLTELFNDKKSLTKKDKDEILSKLMKIQQDMGTNRAFIYKQFNEQMEKTVNEAKGEVELFFQNKINSMASKGLVEQGETNPVSLLASGNNTAEND